MIKRLDVLAVLFSGVFLAIAMIAARSYAACNAVCPAGFNQVGGACISSPGNCSKKCSGLITCSREVIVGSGTITQYASVPCGCQ